MMIRLIVVLIVIVLGKTSISFLGKNSDEKILVLLEEKLAVLFGQ